MQLAAMKVKIESYMCTVLFKGKTKVLLRKIGKKER